MTAAVEAFWAHYHCTTREVGLGIQEDDQDDRHRFRCTAAPLFLFLLACYAALSCPGLIKTAAAKFPAAEFKLHVSGETVAMRAQSTTLDKNHSFHPGPLHPERHALREQAKGPRSCGLLQPDLPAALPTFLPTLLFVRPENGGTD